MIESVTEALDAAAVMFRIVARETLRSRAKAVTVSPLA